MTILGLMAGDLISVLLGIGMTIFGLMAIRSAGDRSDHFGLMARDLISALLGIGMTIFGLIAEIVYSLCWG